MIPFVTLKILEEEALQTASNQHLSMGKGAVILGKQTHNSRRGRISVIQEGCFLQGKERCSGETQPQTKYHLNRGHDKNSWWAAHFGDEEEQKLHMVALDEEYGDNGVAVMIQSRWKQCNHGRKTPPAELAFLLPRRRLIIRP